MMNYGRDSSLHAVESSKSPNDDHLEDYYEEDEEDDGNESEFVAKSASSGAMISTTQVPPTDTASPIQVQFLLNTSSSREVVASTSTNDGFTTVVSKVHQIKVSEECKMTEIQMAIQVAKSA